MSTGPESTNLQEAQRRLEASFLKLWVRGAIGAVAIVGAAFLTDAGLSHDTSPNTKPTPQSSTAFIDSDYSAEIKRLLTGGTCSVILVAPPGPDSQRQEAKAALLNTSGTEACPDPDVQLP